MFFINFSESFLLLECCMVKSWRLSSKLHVVSSRSILTAFCGIIWPKIFFCTRRLMWWLMTTFMNAFSKTCIEGEKMLALRISETKWNNHKLDILGVADRSFPTITDLCISKYVNTCSYELFHLFCLWNGHNFKRQHSHSLKNLIKKSKMKPEDSFREISGSRNYLLPRFIIDGNKGAVNSSVYEARSPLFIKILDVLVST